MASEHSPKQPLVAQTDCDCNGVPVAHKRMETPEKFGAKFALPRGLAPSAAMMSDLFPPDNLLDKIAASSTECAQKAMSRRRFSPVKRKDVLNFFACVQCMGLVRLLSKENFFATKDGWPLHPPLHSLTKTWFDCMFRAIHQTRPCCTHFSQQLALRPSTNNMSLENDDCDPERMAKVSHDNMIF